MAAKINPQWISKIESRTLQGYKLDETITYAPAAKWLVAYCSKRDIPIRIIKLGLGVVRIVGMEHDDSICPVCRGTGVQRKKELAKNVA